MPDKVIRFSAEDNGLSDKINRIGSEMRQAFSNINMGGVLEEADSKFDKIADKIKFIKEQVQSLGEQRNSEYGERIERVNSGDGNDYYKSKQSGVIGSEQAEFNKSIDKIALALEKFLDKLPKETPSDAPTGGKGVNNNYVDFAREFFSGNFGALHQRAARHGISTISRFAQGFGDLGAVLGTSIATGLTALGILVAKGNEDIKSDIEQRKVFDTGSDVANIDSDFLNRRLHISRDDFRKQQSATAVSMRTAGHADTEGVNRVALQNSYPISQQDIQGFDKFYHNGRFKEQSDLSGGSATLTIMEILKRSEQVGLLGVNKSDFSAIPQMIQTTNSIMSQQFASGEKVNSAEAVGLALAGEQIGGNFAGPRAANAFGGINESIRNPNGAGTKGFIMSLLSKAHPTANPLQLQAMMENGMSKENMEAIIPEIEKMPEGYQRDLVIRQLLTGRSSNPAQQALRLGHGDNLEKLRLGAMNTGLSHNEQGEVLTKTLDRSEKFIDAFSMAANSFGNDVKSFGASVEKMVGLGNSKGDTKQGAKETVHNVVKMTDPLGIFQH